MLHARPGNRRLHRLGDERLAALVAAGDVAAFEALYDRHQPALLAFCRHMVGSREDGEDALQQTFLRAHRALLAGRVPDAVRPWLFAIARNRCRTLLASRRPAAVPSEEVEVAGLADDVSRRADLRELVADLARLPEDQRGALVLHELGDLGHAEIAAVIGCPPEKVKALVFQARTTLIAERDARATPCDEIRGQLEVARGGALRRGPLRRHLRQCEPCDAYRHAVARQRARLALILPVAPSAGLKAAVLGAGTTGAGVAAGSGAAGGTIAGGAGGGGATAGGGAAGGGATAAGGTAAGGVAAAGGAAVSVGGVGTGAAAVSAVAAKAVVAKVAVAAVVAGAGVTGGAVAVEKAEDRAPLARFETPAAERRATPPTPTGGTVPAATTPSSPAGTSRRPRAVRRLVRRSRFVRRARLRRAPFVRRRLRRRALRAAALAGDPAAIRRIELIRARRRAAVGDAAPDETRRRAGGDEADETRRRADELDETRRRRRTEGDDPSGPVDGGTREARRRAGGDEGSAPPPRRRRAPAPPPAATAEPEATAEPAPSPDPTPEPEPDATPEPTPEATPEPTPAPSP